MPRLSQRRIAEVGIAKVVVTDGRACSDEVADPLGRRAASTVETATFELTPAA